MGYSLSNFNPFIIFFWRLYESLIYNEISMIGEGKYALVGYFDHGVHGCVKLLVPLEEGKTDYE